MKLVNGAFVWNLNLGTRSASWLQWLKRRFQDRRWAPSDFLQLKYNLTRTLIQEIYGQQPLDQVLSKAAQEVCDILQADRVLIYKLGEAGIGQVVSEAVASSVTPLLGQVFVDDCLQGDYLQRFKRHYVRGADDIEAEGYAPCHLQLLRNQGVRSNLLGAIWSHERLWGLLFVQHCQRPHAWSPVEEDLVHELLDPLGLAIQQAEDVQNLDQSQQKLAGILSNASAAIVSFRVGASLNQKEYDYFSDGCTTVFGFSPEEFKATPNLWEFRILQQDLEAVRSQLEEIIVQGGELTFRYRFLHKDGTLHWISDSISSYWNRERQCWQVTKVAYDISEQKQAELQLREREEQLRASLREKDVLLQEVHHRVKNNLQVISSLMRLQSRTLSEPTAQQAFRDCQYRIQSIELIHKQLYSEDQVALIDLARYVPRLAHDIYSTLVTDAKRIRLGVEADSIELNLDQAIACGLILNELITNACKHAFPQQLQGAIRVSCRQRSGRASLCVSDDGIGLPTTDLKQINPESLGLSLVRDLCCKLKGEISVTLTQGTQICITWPIAPVSDPPQ